MNSTVKIIGLFSFIIILICISIISIFKGFGTSDASHQHADGGFNKQQVEEIISSYINDNPEIIANALISYQQKAEEQKALEAQKSLSEKKNEIENDPTSPVIGNPNGDVIVVEFFDYACGYCKRVFPQIEKLINEDKNVKVIFKEFPILGPNSLVASRVSLAVNNIDPTKYFDFHKQLMTTRATGEEAIVKVATDLGLDREKIIEAMKDSKLDESLANNRALAASLSIRGTPAFIIGETLIPGAISYEDMAKLVEESRKGR